MLEEKHLEVSKFVIIFLGILIPTLFFFGLLQSPIYSAYTINLQGKIVRNDTGYEGLNVSAGSPSCVVDGSSNDTCDFRVRYYDASSGGTLLLTEEFSNVEIGQYKGVFNLSLGSDGSPTAGSYSSVEALIQGEDDVYVEIGFDPAGGNSYTETFTRMSVQATAYAVRSKYSDNAGAATEMAFSGLTSGTNEQAAMVVGTGASLNYENDGTINASSLLSGTWAEPGAIGGTTASTGAFTSLTTSAGITNNHVTLATQMASTASSATQIPVFIDDPSSTTRTLVTRTPAEIRSDIGAGTGDGTVTSVDVGGGTTGLTTSGGPITSSGTITLGGTLNASSGGTGQSTYAVGDLLYASSTTALSRRAVGSDGQVLTASSGVPVWSSLTFLGLTDTPSTYSGSEEYLVRVSADGTALEFVDATGFGGDDWGSQAVVSDSTLTGDGTSGNELGLKLDNSNTWTVAQTFSTSITTPLIIGPSNSLTLGPTTDAENAVKITNAAGTEILSVDTTNSRVGVGTTSPSAMFSVGSSSEFRIDSSGNITRINNVSYSWPASQGAADTVLTNDGAGNLTWGASAGGGLWTDGGTFAYLTSTTDDLVLGADNTAASKFFFDVSEGRMGIGTDTPQASIDIAGTSSSISNSSGDITITPAGKLALVGSMSLEATTTSTTGVIYKGSDSFLHNYQNPTGGGAVPSGANTFLGVFTMGSTATDTAHASFNTAVGEGSFIDNTLGYGNVAFGRRALYKNTEGNKNTAMGTYSLYEITTGGNNAALGYNAGRWITGGGEGSTEDSTSSSIITRDNARRRVCTTTPCSMSGCIPTRGKSNALAIIVRNNIMFPYSSYVGSTSNTIA